MNDISVKRARLHNGWLVVSGNRRGIQNPSLEAVIRCDQVYAWTYHPANPMVIVELPGDAIGLWGTPRSPPSRSTTCYGRAAPTGPAHRYETVIYPTTSRRHARCVTARSPRPGMRPDAPR